MYIFSVVAALVLGGADQLIGDFKQSERGRFIAWQAGIFWHTFECSGQ